MKEEMKRLSEVVELVADKYFVDPSVEYVGNRKIDHWKILLGTLSYFGKKNSLLMGRPGTGKTTFPGVVSSVLSGLPYDLFDILKVQGHPDQTKDTMLARADLGRLAEEGVVWQASIYLPALTLDELNRLSPGKQAIILEYIRTGALEHLGKFFGGSKLPFFATMNYNGTGTYPVPIPSLDRFDISLEFNPGPAYLQDEIQEASNRIDAELKKPKKTEEIFNYLLKKDLSAVQKLTYIENTAKELRAKRKDINDISSLKIEDEMPYSPDATTMLRCMWEEMNTTVRYGDNRRADPCDTSEHNKACASSKITEGISPRAWGAVKHYASMLARYLGDKAVEIEHINAVAPYCLAHRLEFTEDYKAKFAEQTRERGERQEQDLTRRLLKEIKDNYDGVSHPLKLLDSYLSGSLDKSRHNEVKKIIDSPVPDHPLLRTYYNEVKRAWK